MMHPALASQPGSCSRIRTAANPDEAWGRVVGELDHSSLAHWHSSSFTLQELGTTLDSVIGSSGWRAH